DAELEKMLDSQGKSELADTLRSVLPANATCIYIRQPAPLGLGHAVLCARPAVGYEPFFVHLADDLIHAETPCLKQMADVHAGNDWNSVLGVEEVGPAETDKYGIVDTQGSKETVAAIRGLVQTPTPSGGAANRAVVGRYVLTPAIFDHLEQSGAGAGGEIQLTDGIARLMQDESIYAYRFNGKRYDCGSKLG